MSVDIEEILGRELRQVADGVRVPPLPALPREAPRSPSRHWQALLVAAVVLLVVGCAVAIEAISGGSHELDPAPPPPKHGQVESDVPIPRTAPRAPYVLGQKLYVDGKRVPGDWWSVQSGPGGWLAHRAGDTWWWGKSSEAHPIEEDLIGSTAISPNGRYVGEVLGWTDEGDLTGFDTRPGGEGMGATPIELGDPAAGDPVYVRGVTDDGRVIAQGAASAVLWLPWLDGSTVDLTKTAPGQVVVASTAAGLVVTDGAEGAPYLATISDAGVITKTGDVPANDSLVISPGAQSMAWTPPGTLGGEVAEVPSLEAQRLDGSGRVTLRPPTGWGFRVESWAWEDDDYLVSPVVGDGGDGGAVERLVRCSIEAARCVLIDAP
ncbi:hypothetical protein [Nocardioides conyzicola]|uniref:Uncharacterized protein n=1 Tax=Nocardioides conyzicola TaxID=1651781 RepID=A0ABP8WPX2_9ACTN